VVVDGGGTGVSGSSSASLVRAVDAGERPGAATAATHRCLWGALAAAVAWPALGACGVQHAQVAAVGVGLLTMLPWLGPLLGVLFAAVMAALVPQPYAPLLGLAAAALVTLAAAPVQHPPGWLGPLSIPAASAAAVLGGAVWGVFGALLALVLASIAAHLRRRMRADA
jgi:predicted PurR-regulated permease PerM